jgi:DHA1 family tetracycline resistance protein-like MFS transporter
MGVANMVGPGLFTQVFALSIAAGAWHLPGAAFWLASALIVAAGAVALRATVPG